MGTLVYEEMLRQLEEINRNLSRQNQILDNLVSVTKQMLEDPDDIFDREDICPYKEH